MHLRALVLVPTFGALALAGCDKLTATTFAAGALTRAPAISEATGINANLAGIAGDLPAGTAAIMAVAERESLTSTTITPVTDATVHVSYVSGTLQTKTLCPVTGTDGAYATSSISGEAGCLSDLSYVEGVEYTFDIATAADSYTTKVTAPGAISAANVSFTPGFTASSLNGTYPGTNQLVLSTGQDLEISWADDPDAGQKNVFVTIARLNFTGTWPTQVADTSKWQVDGSNPVYNDMPTTPEGLLDVITAQPGTSATIPNATFSQPGVYLIALTKTEISTTTSSNLSIGSGTLAGRSTGFVFLIEP